MSQRGTYVDDTGTLRMLRNQIFDDEKDALMGLIDKEDKRMDRSLKRKLSRQKENRIFKKENLCLNTAQTTM